MRQVITIAPDGSIHSLQHKRGQGLDLKQFGKARIKRATLITHNEDRQQWFIHWPDSESGFWSPEVFEEAQVPFAEFNGVRASDDAPVFFDEYEDAVKAEIAVIQSKQLTGRFFADVVEAQG